MNASTANGPDSAASLTQAFQEFNVVSERLSSVYGQLERRIADLTREVTASRDPASDTRLYHTPAEREMNDRLSVLLEAMPAAVVLVDGRDRIDRFNPAAEQLFTGLHWGGRWTEVLAENLLTRMAPGDWVLRSEQRVSVSQRPLADGGQILVMIDTTEQRQLEERLQRQSRLSDMGEMAAHLAHQIRTPLATALLYGGQLGRAELSATQRTQFAAQLVDGLKHTEKLVSDMLAFSRGGHFVANPLSLRDLLDRSIDMLAPRLQAGGVELKLAIEERGSDEVLGNRDALIGVLSNVLENALNHLPEGGRVALSLVLQEGRAHVVCEDDGPGIPPDLRQRIFDPFFTTRERGTGLGLSVAQSVVYAHGGSIRACASALGGARFDLILPLAGSGGDATSNQGEQA